MLEKAVCRKDVRFQYRKYMLSKRALLNEALMQLATHEASWNQ